MEIQYCTHCLTPSSRPRIGFDSSGKCNACQHAEKKQTEIDWEARRAELVDLIEKHRGHGAQWDCIVPWSGGKDSSTIAYKLKYELGLKPLLVTFSPLIPNQVGAHNRDALLKHGFDHIFVDPNREVARSLAQRFFRERGNQKVAWDAGVTAAPVRMAVSLGVPLVFYAEHGETEYGGKVRNPEASKIRDYTEVVEHLVGDDPRNWEDETVQPADLTLYTYPTKEEIERVGVKALYFAYFFRWSMFENYQYIASKIDFQVDERGRTEGTFTNFDSLDDKTDSLYYYLQFIKFGFGRAVRDSSRMIQNKQMTREKALELARAYDHELPARYFKENLEYLNLSEDDFHGIIDMHRNSEIWKKVGSTWELRSPLR